MKLVSSLVASLVFLGVPAICAADPSGFAVTSPGAGSEVPLTGGITFMFGAAKGATEYECSVTQGATSWKETVSSGSSACDADHRTVVAKKLKPGTATLGIRAKVKGAWSKPASVDVKLVEKATVAAAPPCTGPKCGGGAGAGAPGGATRGSGDAWASAQAGDHPPFSGEAWHAGTLKGDLAKPASWDGPYGLVPANDTALRCPGADDANPDLTAKNGTVSFGIVLDPRNGASKAPGRAAGSLVPVTVTMVNGVFSGQVTLPAAAVTLVENDTGTALRGVKTLKIEGKAFNRDQKFPDTSLKQGRVLALHVTSPNGASCVVEAVASDSYERMANFTGDELNAALASGGGGGGGGGSAPSCNKRPSGRICGTDSDCCSKSCIPDPKGNVSKICR